MNIKEFYLNQYPTDEMGEDLNENATLDGMLNTMLHGKDFYDYIGVYDSLVRERLFEKAAEWLGKDYEFVYRLWLGKL